MGLLIRAGTLRRSRAGTRPEPLEREGPLWTLELPRSRIAISLERDLSFDPVFTRHRDRIERVLHEFWPDLIHITGPSDLGFLDLLVFPSHTDTFGNVVLEALASGVAAYTH